VDRLNKKYQQLVASVTAADEEPLESRGPLEAAIKHLKKETEAVETNCLGLQKEWLQKQTRLVSHAQKAHTSHAHANMDDTCASIGSPYEI
jgi:hypothetical protein